MNEKKSLKIIDDFGKEIEYEILIAFKWTKTNKNYGFARNDKIISPSPFRKTPECLCFEKCGGCDFMHIDYVYQLKLKENFVKSNMSRIGGILEDEYEFEVD